MNLPSLELYITLLLAGLLMIGVEIFIPGGVVGILGGSCLLAAMVVGFVQFPYPYGLISAAGILFASLVGVYLWITVLPRTWPGRRLTLQRDGSDFRLSGKDPDQLTGKDGIAQSTLRPSGVARIHGRRYDVVAEDGAWIEEGTPVRVISVRGSRIVVRASPETPEKAAEG